MIFTLVPALHAQDIDHYFPLDPGNVWVYDITQDEGGGAPGAYQLYQVEWEQVQVDGTPRNVLRREIYDAVYNLESVNRCAFLFGDGQVDDWDMDAEIDNCGVMFPFPLYSYIGNLPGDEIAIGQSSYQIEEIGFFGFSIVSTGGESWSRVSHYAPEIGAFDYYYDHNGRQMQPVGSDDRWNAQLTYARIGGVEYGTQGVLVSSEDDAQLPQSLRITGVHPNPFTDGFQVTTEGRDPSTTTLRVYDLLGREVFAADGYFGSGSMRVSLDGRPAGVYLVQLTTSNGKISTAKVAKSSR